MAWLVKVYKDHVPELTELCEGPLELGREDHAGEPRLSRRDDCWRVVIAGRNENNISRSHVRLDPIGADLARVANISRKVKVDIQDGPPIEPGEVREVPLPVVLTIGRRAIRILDDEDDEQYVGLGTRMEAPGQAPDSTQLLETFGQTVIEEHDHQASVRLLRGLMLALQSAATGNAFCSQAARAALNLIELDVVSVLMLEGATWSWRIEAQETAPHVVADPEWIPSRNVLERARLRRETIRFDPTREALDAPSLVGVRMVIAAPILDRRGACIGALYGERRAAGGTVPRPITTAHAVFIDTLALMIASGLERLEREQDALAMRVRFEQFFTPELARALPARPEMLSGQDAEISVLFADIRGFTRISDRLGPAGTVELVSAVMDALSDCVIGHEGVLVDYIGDELMAMWGAPEPRADHAVLACRAARSMLERLPTLNASWAEALGEPLDLGIGISSGPARVGNVGSRRKFKYGPLGHTVNLASRVQGATRHFKSRLLISAATFAWLGPEFPARRLGQVRLVNVAEPVVLYELAAPDLPDWPELCNAYEAALAAYEEGRVREATRLLAHMMIDHPDDGPTRVLLWRAVNTPSEGSEDFDPAFRLPGKGAP